MSQSYKDESLHSDEDIEESEMSDGSYEEDEQDDEQENENAHDVWQRLKAEAVERHIEEMEELIQKYTHNGDSNEVAQAKAINDMLISFRKELRAVLFEHLKWMHYLRKDPIYKKIMTTRQSLINADDYGWEEATESAINQRKFLLNKLFTKREITQESENDSYPRRFYN